MYMCVHGCILYSILCGMYSVYTCILTYVQYMLCVYTIQFVCSYGIRMYLFCMYCMLIYSIYSVYSKHHTMLQAHMLRCDNP